MGYQLSYRYSPRLQMGKDEPSGFLKHPSISETSRGLALKRSLVLASDFGASIFVLLVQPSTECDKVLEKLNA